MFVRLRIQAHNALKKIMLDCDHEPLFDHTTRLIYDTIKTAETDEGFANELDCECENLFDGRGGRRIRGFAFALRRHTRRTRTTSFALRDNR